MYVVLTFSMCTALAFYSVCIFRFFCIHLPPSSLLSNFLSPSFVSGLFPEPNSSPNPTECHLSLSVELMVTKPAYQDMYSTVHRIYTIIFLIIKADYLKKKNYVKGTLWSLIANSSNSKCLHRV